jgi:hypothetical protein
VIIIVRSDGDQAVFTARLEVALARQERPTHRTGDLFFMRLARLKPSVDAMLPEYVLARQQLDGKQHQDQMELVLFLENFHIYYFL